MSFFDRPFLLAVVLPILLSLRFLRSPPPARPRKIPHCSERVLILGATSGIGREIAHQYSERGAKVCVVGRRQALLNDVARDCGTTCFGVQGDFSNVEDMVRVRDAVDNGQFVFFLGRIVWVVRQFAPLAHAPSDCSYLFCIGSMPRGC